MPEYDRAIPPGGEGKIRVTLDPRTCIGGEEKSTVVQTNDPLIPMFTLHMKAELEL